MRLPFSLVLGSSAALVTAACTPGSGGPSDGTGSETTAETSGGSSTGTTGSTSSETALDSSSGGDQSETGTTGDPIPPAMCPPQLDPAVELGAGSHDLVLEFDGVERHFTVDVPSSHEAGVPAPLVLNLHGFGSNAWQQDLFSLLNIDAHARGYIVVYPDGLDSSWNGGLCCGTSAQDGVDDVGFLLAMLDELAGMLCYDPTRVYSTGMSNGGFMSHRLACEASDRFAAIAPVAGAIGIDDCAPTRPVPVHIVHGALDASVPAFAAVDAFEFWADANGCEGSPTRTELGDGTYCDQFESERCEGGAAVELCMVGGLGHCWPGGSEPLCAALMDSYDDTIDANVTLLDFFDAHRLP